MILALLAYAGLVVLALALVEVTAVSILVALDLRAGHPLRLSLRSRLREHPRLSERFSYAMFDPIVLTRITPLSARGDGRFVNAHGFLDNGQPTDPFPGKPPGLYRVVLFGGSSAEGVGLQAPETIAAQLECRLAESGQFGRVQVLNFAMSGGFSWTAVVRYLSEVTYYEPDAIVLLEGWNDVIGACFEHRRRGLGHPIINWAQVAYEYHDYWNNLPTVVVAGARAPTVMTWTYVLVERVLPKPPLSTRLADVYRRHPVYALTGARLPHDPSLALPFASNLEAIGLHASANGRLCLAYLQPYAMSGKPLTPEEDQSISNVFARLDRDNPGAGWERRAAEDTTRMAFEHYADAIRELARRHAANPRFKLIDIRTLFEGRTEKLYLDNIHYSAAGARRIANRIADDLLNAQHLGRCPSSSADRP